VLYALKQLARLGPDLPVAVALVNVNDENSYSSLLLITVTPPPIDIPGPITIDIYYAVKIKLVTGIKPDCSV